jgi:glyoxylase-like metal-dependent hydrolase (beta-lactamase superfamily II)/rhodanese-related sulfurtransferase
MFIKQLYTNCLSEAAYYIESNGEAAIIDPLRDIEIYADLAKERNSVIKYIFETHFHADFVSGHLDLGKLTGAPIVYGPGTVTKYPVRVAEDGEIFKLGTTEIIAVHTPGHTLESTCWLLKNEDGKDHAIFTGDTLFIGDVGRPDLSSGNLSKEELAAILYHSLQTKIMPLNNDVIVYPAHGPGSACGKHLGTETVSTIGEQKLSNYALKQANLESFIESITEGLEEAPKYFQVNARINKEGYTPLEDVREKALTALSVDNFKDKMKDAIIIDSRPADEFVHGFVPGSVGIGLNGRFAEWAGSLLSFDEPILLVCEQGKEQETVTRLARIGLDKMEGYLDGGYQAWVAAGNQFDLIINVQADEVAMDIPFDENLLIVDVRNESEYANGHVEDAFNLPLKDLNDPGRIAMLPENANLYVHCAGGYRSIIAASLLKRQGLHNIRNIEGGYNALAEEPTIKKEKDKAVLN